MTKDMPAMDEKGLKAAIEAHDRILGLPALQGDKILIRGIIAAYLAATARNGEAETIAKLRGALIAAGRHAGAGLSDEVSNEFLMLVPEEIRLVIARLRASLRVVPEVEVVKLEWEETDERWWGAQPMHRLCYEIRETDRGVIRIRRPEDGRWSNFDGDFEAAKAMFQADFASRIRSCLATPQPSPDADGDAA